MKKKRVLIKNTTITTTNNIQINVMIEFLCYKKKKKKKSKYLTLLPKKVKKEVRTKIYIWGSFNKEKKKGTLSKELVIGSTDNSCTFSKKSEVIDPFMSKKTVGSITFFTDSCTLNFFFAKGQCISILWTVFSTQAHRGKPKFSQIVHIFFFTKTCFSIHITHSSLNFPWFAYLSQQNLTADFCSSLENCLICCHFE